MLPTTRIRLRSRAGVPFEYASWLTVPTDWIELVVPTHSVAELRAHRWLECEPLEPIADDMAPVAPDAPIRVRVRAPRPPHPQRTVFGEIGPQVRVLDVTAEQLATLRANPQLEVRVHDEALFTSSMFVRLRARSEKGATIGVRWYAPTWIACSLLFDDFSQLRCERNLELELLDPVSAPPLRRVRLRSNTGKPYYFMRGPIPADHPVEMELYPREIERAIDVGALAIEEVRSEEVVAAEPDDALAAAEQQWLTHDVPVATASTPPAAQPNAPVNVAPQATYEDANDAIGARVTRWASREDVRNEGHQRGGYLLDEILTSLGLGPEARTRTLEMEVAAVLRKLGWEHLPMRRRNGARVRPYLPPRGE